MPWYNFIDPIFLHQNKKKITMKSYDIFGVFEKYTFSNMVGDIVFVKINISEDHTKIFGIKLRKINTSRDFIEPAECEFFDTLNRDSTVNCKKYNTKEYLNEILKDKPVCIKNLTLDKDNLLIGDIYIDNTLINNLFSLPYKNQKKKVTFSNIDDSIVSLYTLITEKIMNIF